MTRTIPSLLLRRCLRALLPLAAGLFLSGAAVAQEFERERLIAHAETGDRVLYVEIADDPAEKQQGLMWRHTLAPHHGMLFLYRQPTEAAFWMRNTYIPLDIIFIRADGRVHRVAAHAVPLSDTRIPSQGPILAVLEIGAGLAERYGIGPGTRISHRSLPSG